MLNCEIVLLNIFRIFDTFLIIFFIILDTLLILCWYSVDTLLIHFWYIFDTFSIHSSIFRNIIEEQQHKKLLSPYYPTNPEMGFSQHENARPGQWRHKYFIYFDKFHYISIKRNAPSPLLLIYISQGPVILFVTPSHTRGKKVSRNIRMTNIERRNNFEKQTSFDCSSGVPLTNPRPLFMT